MDSCPIKCKHAGHFIPRLYIDRAPDGRFLARLSLRCQDCMEWFEFFGVAPGEDPDGVRCSKDRKEIHMAIGTPQSLHDYYQRAIASLIIQKKAPTIPIPLKPIKPTIKVYKAA